MRKGKGDRVVDLFGGYGSTLITCERMRRVACLMEIDPRYCDAIVRRWQEFIGKQAVHLRKESLQNRTFCPDTPHAGGECSAEFGRRGSVEMAPKITSISRGTIRRPGSATYSRENYCDDGLFRRRVEGAWSFAASLKEQPRNEPTGKTDYWSLSDDELEQIARRHSIAPYGRAGKQGETFYVDRERVIAELLKRDDALRSSPPPPNVIHVGNMYGSAIQQGSPGSTVRLTFQTGDPDLRRLVDDIKKTLEKADLSSNARSEIDADLGSIASQMSSPKPKTSVIRECLHSLRATFESAAGSGVWVAIIYEINRLLAAHPH